MNILPAGIGKLHPHLASAALAILAAGTIAWYANKEQKDAEARLRALTHELSALKNHHGENDASHYRDHAATFAKMRDQGWIGGDKRIDWMRQLDELHARWKIMAPSYRFFPVRPLGESLGEGYRYHGSSMRWQMQLAHEARLPAILDELQRNAKAIIHVRSCLLARRTPAEVDSTPLVYLNIDCQIDWITLHPPGAGS